jgi:multiple sugar transport system ATP-binding protein
MAVASLSLRHLERHYGHVRAVDDLNLEVPDGAFVTLLGPSGCGKSTTLNLIAGLDRPSAGTVHLGDRDVTKVPPNERRMAMVFQSYALYPNMTVFENIAFSLKLLRRPAAEITERVTRVAEMLDIAHLLHRKPAELSGGQQQRVALGRALIKQPLVFLLDEPFSNLDAALRARMRTEVKHLHLALGTTSVFVTHDQEEAMTLSDVICVMRDGKIVQSGTQQEIYGKPRNLYVAGFVGKPKMSLLRGSIEQHADGVAFVGPRTRIELGPAAALGLADGSWRASRGRHRSHQWCNWRSKPRCRDHRLDGADRLGHVRGARGRRRHDRGSRLARPPTRTGPAGIGRAPTHGYPSLRRGNGGAHRRMRAPRGLPPRWPHRGRS